MRLSFTKMHGLGNDFVVIDAIRQTVRLTPEQIRFLADRHCGVGADQVLLVETPTHSQADFRYRIYNADGSEVAQCGNGARCFARFISEKKGLSSQEICVETHAGLLYLSLLEGNLVRVNMGIPHHAPESIPLRSNQEALYYSVLIEGESWQFSAVSLGNPHAVLRVQDIETAPVQTVGNCLEKHPIFPERVNVGFMEILGRHHIRLRVFERGSGETLACGSGACAAVIVGIEQDELDSPVQVTLRGGSLDVTWAGRGTPVLMTGPAVTVFEGQIDMA